MITRSRGFTLIELLVVVAIIGILAGVGIVAYSGYVDASKKKSAQNIMMQISLANTEYYSDNGIYYRNSTGTSAKCYISISSTSISCDGDTFPTSQDNWSSEDNSFTSCSSYSLSNISIQGDRSGRSRGDCHPIHS